MWNPGDDGERNSAPGPVVLHEMSLELVKERSWRPRLDLSYSSKLFLNTLCATLETQEF